MSTTDGVVVAEDTTEVSQLQREWVLGKPNPPTY